MTSFTHEGGRPVLMLDNCRPELIADLGFDQPEQRAKAIAESAAGRVRDSETRINAFHTLNRPGALGVMLWSMMDPGLLDRVVAGLLGVEPTHYCIPKPGIEACEPGPCGACLQTRTTDPCASCGLHSRQGWLVAVAIGDERDDRIVGRIGRLWAARRLLKPFRAPNGVTYPAAWSRLDPDIQRLVRAGLPRGVELEDDDSVGVAPSIWDVEGEATPPAVIPGLAWMRSTTAFEAGPKWGKTTVLSDAISQILTTGQWLGQEAAAPATPVLWYSEMSIGTLRAWLERRCGDARPEVHACRVKGVGAMRTDAEALSPKLVVVDSLIELLAVIVGRDEGKASDVRWVGRTLRSIFGPDAAILLVQHTRKSDGVGRGSGDLHGLPDQIVSMADDKGHVAFLPPPRHRTGRILRYTGRWLEADRRIRFDDQTHGYQLLDDAVDAPAGDDKRTRDAATREAIVEFVGREPGSPTRAILTAVQGRNADIRRVLNEMIDSKEVIQKPGPRGAILRTLAETASRTPRASSTRMPEAKSANPRLKSTVSGVPHSNGGTRDAVAPDNPALEFSAPAEQSPSLPPRPPDAEPRALACEPPAGGDGVPVAGAAPAGHLAEAPPEALGKPPTALSSTDVAETVRAWGLPDPAVSGGRPESQ